MSKAKKPPPRTWTLASRRHLSERFGEWWMIWLLLDDAEGCRSVLHGQLTSPTLGLVEEFFRGLGVAVSRFDSPQYAADPVGGTLF